MWSVQIKLSQRPDQEANRPPHGRLRTASVCLSPWPPCGCLSILRAHRKPTLATQRLLWRGAAWARQTRGWLIG